MVDGGGNLAGLEQLLEAPQIFPDRLRGFATEELRDKRGRAACGRRVLEMHCYLGALAASYGIEVH
jgi:hypothetical protein